MRLIAMSFFANSPLLALPLIALAIFVLVFLSVTLRALFTKASSYEAIARLPLESQEESRVEQ